VSFQQAPCAAGGGERLTVPPVNTAGGDVLAGQRMRAEWERNIAVRAAAEQGRVIEGMTPGEVAAVLGTPSGVSRSVVDGEVTERLHYRFRDGSTQSVSFRNGQAVGWQVYEPTHQPPPPPRPCFTDLEIRNADVRAGSITLTEDERRAAKRRVAEMRSCRR
jgi:hypothetical protein